MNSVDQSLRGGRSTNPLHAELAHHETRNTIRQGERKARKAKARTLTN